MKRNKITLTVIVLVYAVLIVLAFRKCSKENDFEKRVERMNAHIKYLHDEEGYSWEASRKIGATEAQFIPMDDEYNALKED